MLKSGDIKLSKEIFLTSYFSDEGTNEPFRMDVTQLVQEIQLYESINRSTLTGVLVLVDAAGLLDRLPLTGNELLEFTAHSPGFTPEDKSTHGYDFTMKSGFPMFVYSIKSISEPSPGVKTYALRFCSKELIKDRQRKLCKAFEGPIHDTVFKVLRGHLKSKKNWFFEQTTPIVKYVIPKKSPLDTIKFLCKESVSKKFKSAGFFFWETSDGFHFKSLENMITNPSGVAKRAIAQYTNSPKLMAGARYKTKKGNTIIKGNNERVFEFKILNRYDTLSNINKGVYASKLVTYDAFSKEFDEQDFSYPHEFVNTTHMGQISKDTTSETNGLMPIYNYEDNKLLSDFSEGRYMFLSATQGMHHETTDKEPFDTADIKNTIQRSISQQGAFNSFSIELLVPGNTAVTAGSVIEFSTLTSSGVDNPTIDPYMSGTYLVVEVRHIMQSITNNTIHNMTLICAKDSISRPYMKNDKEVLHTEKDQYADFDQYEIDGILS
jgi:hypothetical protein